VSTVTIGVSFAWRLPQRRTAACVSAVRSRAHGSSFASEELLWKNADAEAAGHSSK